MKNSRNSNIDPGFWIGIVLVLLLMFMCSKCHSQVKYDTLFVESPQITGIVKSPSKDGKEKIYAIYKNEVFEDLVPMSKTTYDYYMLCRQHGIHPSLGLKCRLDGTIVSIVKYGKNIKRKHNPNKRP